MDGGPFEKYLEHIAMIGLVMIIGGVIVAFIEEWIERRDDKRGDDNETTR